MCSSMYHMGSPFVKYIFLISAVVYTVIDVLCNVSQYLNLPHATVLDASIHIDQPMPVSQQNSVTL